jgi:AraC-like DNA-binding protein
METPQFLLKELVTLILFEMIEKFYEEAIDKKEDKSFSNAIIALFNQPENIPLRLNEVCQKYPCSIQYAIRRFKEEGHAETPNKIFQRIKMGYACRLLKTSDLTILSISESIGYNHLGYFNRLFYETYGMTPREYRKRYRNAKQ